MLQIADEVPPEHRDAIQASVATLARRSAEASKRAFEHSKARNELIIAMTRPLRRMIEEDAVTSEALAAASRRLEAYRSDPPTQEPAWPTVKLVEGRSQTAEAGGVCGSDLERALAFPMAMAHRRTSGSLERRSGEGPSTDRDRCQSRAGAVGCAWGGRSSADHKPGSDCSRTIASAHKSYVLRQFRLLWRQRHG